MKLIAIWSIVALIILVPVWWWALHGMSGNVVIAWFMTDCVLSAVAWVATILEIEKSL